jgi:hypothetical protein
MLLVVVVVVVFPNTLRRRIVFECALSLGLKKQKLQAPEQSRNKVTILMVL